MAKEIFTYTNEAVTVVWQPRLCTHSTICFKGLPPVFNPRKRPWVNIDGAAANEIIEQVGRCPSGALSIETKPEPTPLDTKTNATNKPSVVIEIQANGPLLVSGGCVLKLADGQENLQTGHIALCRCGHSHNKPFCDGTHAQTRFEG